MPDGMGASERREIAAKVRAASTSFYEAMRLLPRERREAIFAVYAFCRDVDDIADDDGIRREERQKGLDDWRRRVAALYDGKPDHLVTRALVQPVETFALKQDDFLAVIDGMEMDANGPVVAPDETTFDLYCDRVASAVGRLCVCIFGEPGHNGQQVAHYLGRALQLTNILRDVDEDAATGRLYLPREVLVAHGIDWSDLTGLTRQPGYVTAWRELAGRAQNLFDAARTAISQCDRRKMRPARIMMEVYHANLVRMRALSDDELSDPAVSKRRVSKGRKLMIALRHGLF